MLATFKADQGSKPCRKADRLATYAARHESHSSSAFGRYYRKWVVISASESRRSTARRLRMS
jgi:hypothetical protein